MKKHGPRDLKFPSCFYWANDNGQQRSDTALERCRSGLLILPRGYCGLTHQRSRLECALSFATQFEGAMHDVITAERNP
jgi:hypothetical protein